LGFELLSRFESQFGNDNVGGVFIWRGTVGKKVV